MTDAQQPVFNIEKLFVKDLSLEVPNAPDIYLERQAPQIDVNMSTESRAMGEDMYYTGITVTVTAKVGDKTMFLVECTQSGVFRDQDSDGTLDESERSEGELGQGIADTED